ncbi:HTH domain-containing protein [Blautia obeum]|uniref:HTH domain-containing protein n=1 Tax=Blautia obeum TaxID=40520 RepID=A0A4Q5GFK6_9FIRM|nr:ATP-binding protein [Blautia obeum]MZT69158.1 HTH domain-containing protein [Blautia obeum]RYT66918.1 HTH domain-containing protein [Blautia obeum]
MARDTLFSGESKNIEYKVTLPDKSEKYMKTIVAFANTQGGKLVVGVDDKTHEIVGVENDILFQLMDGIANAVSDSCMPQIIPDIEPQTVDEKTVIIVSVEAGKNRPYYLKSKGKENGTYIRVAGTSRQAFPEKIRELEMEGARISWDELTCVGYPVSKEATEKLCSDIESFREKAGMTERSVKKEQLINWKILKQSEGQLLATNAYALLTSDYFPFSKTQCAVFKGIDRAIFLDKREFTGPIYTQIEEAVDFVLRNIRLGATIEGLVRKEKYELPPEAIREMIINAHCHRNLLDESCIQVAVYDDRLEVTSPGGLYNGLTYEEVMNGHSKIRNKAIANIFSQMGLVEAWGSGIKRIFNAAKEYDLPEPKFQEFDNMFRVELFRNSLPMTSENKHIGETSEKHRRNIGETSEKHGIVELNSTQQEIVKLLLENNQLSAAKLAEKIGVASRNIESNIKKLKEFGILVRHGSPKNGYWEVTDCGEKNNEDTE